MVALNDLAQAGVLSQELTAHRRAIAALERNAPITALTVGSVTVPLRDLAYPEQMGQAVRAALQAHADELKQQLDELGVTLDEPASPAEPAAAQPAQAAQAPAPQQAPPPPPERPQHRHATPSRSGPPRR